MIILNYKMKFYLVLVSSTFYIFFIFLKNFKENLNVSRKVEQLTKDVSSLSASLSIPNHSVITGKQLQNQWIAGEFKENVLQSVSDLCIKDNLTLIELKDPSIDSTQGYIIETSMVSVSGSFHGLVKCAYSIEQVEKIGNIVSLSIKKTTRERSPMATLYLQKVRKP